jgi:hypothetical protein
MHFILYRRNFNTASRFLCVAPCVSTVGSISRTKLLFLQLVASLVLNCCFCLQAKRYGWQVLWNLDPTEVHVVTNWRLRTLVLFSAEVSDSYSLQKVQSCSGTHSGSYWMGTGCVLSEVNRLGRLLTAYCLPLSRGRRSGVIFLSSK